jgi:threonine aldolase
MNANGVIDLRSDTVTLPTEEMLEASRYAKLGDDVFGEDPTVNELQELAAERMGKESALLFPSGTQANLVSLMSNCERGKLVLLESESHIYWYEVGGVCSVAGLMPWPIKTLNGAFSADQLGAAMRPDNIHFPDASLVCIENTHNRHGGTIIKPDEIQWVSAFAKDNSLKLYMDGARIFNAAVGLGVDVKEFTVHVDNLMFSLSKGLCCPVGSVLVGTSEFIGRARKIRKLLGGGMRQAGVIAAHGIVALETMVDRLREDHDNARFLAEKLSKIEGIELDLARVETNIVSCELAVPGLDDGVFLRGLKESGVLALAQAKNKIRMVMHRGIERVHIEAVVEAVEAIVEKTCS